MGVPDIELKGRVRDQGRGVEFRVWARVRGVAVMTPGSYFGSLFGGWKGVALYSSNVSRSSEVLQRNPQAVAACLVLNWLLRKGQVVQRG